MFVISSFASWFSCYVQCSDELEVPVDTVIQGSIPPIKQKRLQWEPEWCAKEKQLKLHWFHGDGLHLYILHIKYPGQNNKIKKKQKHNVLKGEEGWLPCDLRT